MLGEREGCDVILGYDPDPRRKYITISVSQYISPLEPRLSLLFYFLLLFDSQAGVGSYYVPSRQDTYLEYG